MTENVDWLSLVVIRMTCIIPHWLLHILYECRLCSDTYKTISVELLPLTFEILMRDSIFLLEREA
jgi:hypothetical protein